MFASIIAFVRGIADVMGRHRGSSGSSSGNPVIAECSCRAEVGSSIHLLAELDMSSITSWGLSVGEIHPTAVVHPRAHLHETVSVGPHCVIGEHVQVGAKTVLAPHVVINGYTEIGEGNEIFPGAVIGMDPQDLKYNGAPSRVVIGNHNRIREYVTINRATDEDEPTVLGNNNLLMAYVHVAHNCVIEDNVVITNSVNLAGHVHIESQARVGGMVGIHQFTHIGRLAMVGGMCRVDRDVPPFMLAEGHPGRIRGLNLVGLKRAQSTDLPLNQLKEVYRILYQSHLSLEQAIDTLKSWPESVTLNHLLTFLETSVGGPPRRGILPSRH